MVAGVEAMVFGRLPDGAAIRGFRCRTAGGLGFEVIEWGATLRSLQVPDRTGRLGEVVLGLGSLGAYRAQGASIGATVGRTANRIARARFVLDGREVTLRANDGRNHLHGGPEGFGRRTWRGAPLDPGSGAVGVELRLASDALEEGYPGRVEARVRVTLTDAGVLTFDYDATTDATTVVGLTNHAYWNLGGSLRAFERSGSALGHVLQVDAEQVLDVDAESIPTGRRLPVDGTGFDFREPRRLGDALAALAREGPERRASREPRGIDHCYAVAGGASVRGAALRRVASLHEPESGRRMTVLTTEPGLQVYTGNFLDGGPRAGGAAQHAAICLEAQGFPDAPNQPSFPSARLDPGERYTQRTEHHFSVEADPAPTALASE